MRRNLSVVLLAVTMLAGLSTALPAAVADTGDAGAQQTTVCTPWSGGSHSKSRACVDPLGDCILWSEGWVGSTGYQVCWVPGPGNNGIVDV